MAKKVADQLVETLDTAALSQTIGAALAYSERQVRLFTVKFCAK